MGSQNEEKYKGISLCVDLLEYTGKGRLPSKRTRCSMCIQFVDFFNHLFILCACVCVLGEGACACHSMHVESEGKL